MTHLPKKINRNSNHIDEFFGIWNEMEYDVLTESELEDFGVVMNNYARINKQFINIYSLKQKRVLYLSDNLGEVLGYDCSPEEYKKWSAFYWLRDLPIAQSMFFVQFSVFYKTTVQKLLEANKISNLTFYMHNFKLTPPNKEKQRLGLTCTVLDLDKSPFLDKILIINTNIDSLIKDKEAWWCNLSINNANFYSKHSEHSSFKPKHILSEKELAVLDLIEKGLKSKEIAEKLEISTATVDKHRNNMLEWTGAKDISSLIQLAKIGKIL